MRDSFGTLKTLTTRSGTYGFYDMNELESKGIAQISALPFSVRVMLESLLRNEDGYQVTKKDIEALAGWGDGAEDTIVPLKLARVILQDFTGVPAVVDLAGMRDATAQQKRDPARINPVVQVDLVIDHSVQVDAFGTDYAFSLNVQKEYERNLERYQLLKWAQQALKNFRVVPPGTGIVHQVNLEYLAQVVMTEQKDGATLAFPDSLVGTDSHTTMVNGLGVLGFGVGGIEAEAVMLGQPYYMLAPKVVGLKLYGELQEGATATDLVLTITEILRKHGVVGKFVEFYGPGVQKLSLQDRATIANMAPEYGATVGFFPVDEETLAYLRQTGRPQWLVELVEGYTKAVGIFRTSKSEQKVRYSEYLELDISTVEPSLAGPKRPQDRVPLKDVKKSFVSLLTKPAKERGYEMSQEKTHTTVVVKRTDYEFALTHGAVVIAAITSCTNTSNPTVMLGAGLLAKKAVLAGLRSKPWVKTSLAPGSRVVSDYLVASGLMPYLEALGFHVVGYGCTTCIGNSGPLPSDIAKAVEAGDLVAVAVLSGNRNFEGRINPHARASYLCSPMLVIAYALAGRIDIDFATEPLGFDPNGRAVYLKDIWPSMPEIRDEMRSALDPELFRTQYARVFEGDEQWQSLQAPAGELYLWNSASSYIQKPPFFETLHAPEPKSIKGARVLLVLGDSVTTDHISPAGAIPVKSPAGQYLISKGVKPEEFNSYGSRRGNHEVMIRGTFANIRIKNLMLEGIEGGYAKKLPEGDVDFVFNVAMRYKQERTPLLVIAGKEYGTGSSRDWAAKGTYLLGVKAVLAESFERIHRSNLVGMGVLPLEFVQGQNRETLGLNGYEVYDILGLEDLQPRKVLEVVAKRDDGFVTRFQALARLDTVVEVDYYKNGGILHTVLLDILKDGSK